MIDIMLNLEPYSQPANAQIYNELEEIHQVTFFTNGVFEVGFEINSQSHYVLRFKNSSIEHYSEKHCKSILEPNGFYKSFGKVIGIYGCTFDKDCTFMIRTVSECKGYFIRKPNWRKILYNHSMLFESFRNKIQYDYMQQVKAINRLKHKLILKMKQSKHTNEYKYVIGIDDPHSNDAKEYQQFILNEILGNLIEPNKA